MVRPRFDEEEQLVLGPSARNAALGSPGAQLVGFSLRPVCVVGDDNYPFTAREGCFCDGFHPFWCEISEGLQPSTFFKEQRLPPVGVAWNQSFDLRLAEGDSFVQGNEKEGGIQRVFVVVHGLGKAVQQQ